jgi:hypothetical protein
MMGDQKMGLRGRGGGVMREIEKGGLYYTMPGETIVDPTRNLRNICAESDVCI